MNLNILLIVLCVVAVVVTLVSLRRRDYKKTLDQVHTELYVFDYLQPWKRWFKTPFRYVSDILYLVLFAVNYWARGEAGVSITLAFIAAVIVASKVFRMVRFNYLIEFGPYPIDLEDRPFIPGGYVWYIINLGTATAMLVTRISDLL
jgi:hypothetical protein